MTQALITCRTGLPLYCTYDGCDDATVGAEFLGNGFEWYDTDQVRRLWLWLAA